MIQQISIENRRGNILRGVLNLPQACDEGCRVPVWMNLHGFGGNKCGYKNLYVQQARKLEENGIAGVRFDFFGNGESDGEFDEMTFTSLLEDAEDIFAWIKEQPWADTNHLILSGQSMGGYVASTVAPRLQPEKLILQCPGAAMWNGALERVEAMEAKGVYTADVEGLSFSTTFNKTMHPYEPYASARGYDGKVLLVRGTKDQLVSLADCEKYQEVYGDACTFVSIEEGNHNFANISVRRELEKVIIDFILGGNR